MTQEDVIKDLIKRYPPLAPLEQKILETVDCLIKSFQKGHTLLVCGNGGSAADSLHFTGELMKEFAIKRDISPELKEKFSEIHPDTCGYYMNALQGALPTISLVNEVGLMTAYANDTASNLVFAQQVLAYGKKGGVLFCFSTSGNSENIIHAAKVAKVLEMTVVSLTGSSGGKLKEYSDFLLNVPCDITYQIQELHLPIYHAISLALEDEFFGGN